LADQVKEDEMRWAGHVVRMGEMRNTYKILVGRTEGRDHSEDLGSGGKIILKSVLEKEGWGADLIHLAQETVGWLL
jgi:hypothetical protein